MALTIILSLWSILLALEDFVANWSAFLLLSGQGRDVPFLVAQFSSTK